MNGFIVKSNDTKFLCDLIDFLNNYPANRSKETVIVHCNDVERYEDAVDFIEEHDELGEFLEWRER